MYTKMYVRMLRMYVPGMGRLLNKSNQLQLQLLSVIGNANTITITVFIKNNQLKCDYILM